MTLTAQECEELDSIEAYAALLGLTEMDDERFRRYIELLDKLKAESEPHKLSDTVAPPCEFCDDGGYLIELNYDQDYDQAVRQAFHLPPLASDRRRWFVCRQCGTRQSRSLEGGGMEIKDAPMMARALLNAAEIAPETWHTDGPWELRAVIKRDGHRFLIEVQDITGTEIMGPGEDDEDESDEATQEWHATDDEDYDEAARQEQER